MLRRYVVCGSEMGFCNSAKRIRATLLNKLSRRFLYLCRNSAAQLYADRLTVAIKPINERFSSENRRRRDCKVRLCFRSLLQPDLFAASQHRLLDHTRVGKVAP